MKVCVITTSRADWNALGMVAKALAAEGADVGIIFEPSFSPYHDIDQLPMLETPIGADLAVLLGDRHETLRMAVDLIEVGVPIAHLAGGDITDGSADNLFRNAITKMAHLHFPTNTDAARRIIKMGEAPSTVFMLGSASVDRIFETPIIPLSTLRQKLGITQDLPIIIVNWQVPTAEENPSAGLTALLSALDPLGLGQPGEVCAFVFVGVNPETGSEEAEALIESFINDRNYAYGFKSLPGNEYLSLLAQAECLVGNSSSAFYEAPYFGTPAVNIGERQNGRWCPPNIVGSEIKRSAIGMAIMLARGGGKIVSAPYGEPGAAKRIAQTILANPVKGIRKVMTWPTAVD